MCHQVLGKSEQCKPQDSITKTNEMAMKRKKYVESVK